jgi:N-methylhydantoinase A/oxoprolinase/acetone carboxylase beta subunit
MREKFVLSKTTARVVVRAYRELAEAGVEAIAVCLLHSNRNRAHERAVHSNSCYG